MPSCEDIKRKDKSVFTATNRTDEGKDINVTLHTP
jgi:hypothetical protein